jgi:hypothetical protein
MTKKNEIFFLFHATIALKRSIEETEAGFAKQTARTQSGDGRRGFTVSLQDERIKGDANVRKQIHG